MPLTNEAVIPVGQKDFWNSLSPNDELAETTLDEFFYNPELGLYMDASLFGGAVPAFAPLRIQRNSLFQVFGGFDFGNTNDGLYPLKGSGAVAGTALDDAIFGTLLLPAAGKPRSVDLWPAFFTGVPNMPPYQLATGKTGFNPLTPGKPFVNNFLPNGGDMLRLNMATPITPRNDPAFSSMGLINAAVLGLTDPTYTASGTSLVWIPNMDGFPNGRRLEDDVTRIELQAVSGVVLAAIGLWYDDYDTAGSPVTTDLLDVLTYSTGVESNDTAFSAAFPFEQTPWSGRSNKCSGMEITYVQPSVLGPTVGVLGMNSPEVFVKNYPNPFAQSTTFRYRLRAEAKVTIQIRDLSGRLVATLADRQHPAGEYDLTWDSEGKVAAGTYVADVVVASASGSHISQSIKIVKQ
jgi:hypothetical protein